MTNLLKVVVLVLGLVLGACDTNKSIVIKELPINAPLNDVMSTLVLLSNSAMHSVESKANAKELEDLLNKEKNKDNFDDYWKFHKEIHIERINSLISQKSSIKEIIEIDNKVIIPVVSGLALLFSIVTILTGIIGNNIRARRTKEDDKNKIYQELEFASIEFFKWEAANKEELVEIRNVFKEKWNKESSRDGEGESLPQDIRKHYKNIINQKQEILLETWCTIQLNLFEIIIESTLEDTARGDVFVTWIPWIFEAAHEDGFEPMWQGRLFAHYLGDCGSIIDDALRTSKKKEFVVLIGNNYDKKFKTIKKDIEVLKKWIEL